MYFATAKPVLESRSFFKCLTAEMDLYVPHEDNEYDGINPVDTEFIDQNLILMNDSDQN